MFGRIKNIFKPAKSSAKRMSLLVLGVFMLQIFAAGFCVSTASAMPIQKASNMEHCMGSVMNMTEMSNMETTMSTHACAHCDMPDVNLSFDKYSFDVADIAADFFILAIVPTALDTKPATFVVSPPDLQTRYTSLLTYNLNLRIRV